jgi:hypothetical protein
MTESHDEEAWETEEVELAKPVGAVVSVRLHPALADRVFEEARRRDVPTSAVLREAIEEYLANPRGTAATLDISVSSADVPVAFYTGRSTLGRTASGPATIQLDDDQLVLGRR